MIEGRGPCPVLTYQLAQGLPDTSLTAALISGGREHFGWGIDRHMRAGTYDALNNNTRATGNWEKGKVPTFPEWPRPDSLVSEKTPEPKTVADIYAAFSARR